MFRLFYDMHGLWIRLQQKQLHQELHYFFIYLFIYSYFLVTAEPFAGRNFSFFQQIFASSKNKPINFYDNSGRNNFENFAVGNLTWSIKIQIFHGFC